MTLSRFDTMIHGDHSVYINIYGNWQFSDDNVNFAIPILPMFMDLCAI